MQSSSHKRKRDEHDDNEDRGIITRLLDECSDSSSSGDDEESVEKSKTTNEEAASDRGDEKRDTTTSIKGRVDMAPTRQESAVPARKRKKYRRVPTYYESRAQARDGSHTRARVRANWCRSKQCYVYYPDQNGELLKRAPRTPQRAAVRKHIRKVTNEAVDHMSDTQILQLIRGPKPRYLWMQIEPSDENDTDRVTFVPGVLFENGVV